MIKIDVKQEPRAFDDKVRQPGLNYLRDNGIPTKSRDFPSFWRQAANDLHSVYSGICAYTCHYIMPPGSVDHYLPKMQHPQQAYEWSNYRLSSPRVNSYKGDNLSVLDPFLIHNNWFEIDFPSCLVKASSDTGEPIRRKIDKTIKVLKLNDDDGLVQERLDILVDLRDGIITIEFLRKRYPFLAKEVERQGIQDNLKNIFKNKM